MNLGSQRMMKMGGVVREPLHCLVAQPREAAIFEGEPYRALWLLPLTTVNGISILAHTEAVL
jgi:hypothetical protein